MSAGLDWETATPNDLHNLLSGGKSYTQVAQLYGVSRNTVSGQVYRWRRSGVMPAPRNPKLSKTPKSKSARSKNVPFTLSGKTLQAPPPPQYKPPKAPPPKTRTPPTNEPVPLLQLEAGMCAFVVQERPYLFCGCREISNQRFRLCAYHEQGFFNEAVQRRNQR